MYEQKDRLVRQVIVDVEQESVEDIFQQGPDKVTDEEANQRFEDRICR